MCIIIKLRTTLLAKVVEPIDHYGYAYDYDY